MAGTALMKMPTNGDHTGSFAGGHEHGQHAGHAPGRS